jgi:hypothetical protein
MTWAGFKPRTRKIGRNGSIQKIGLKKGGTLTAPHSVREEDPSQSTRQKNTWKEREPQTVLTRQSSLMSLYLPSLSPLLRAAS